MRYLITFSYDGTNYSGYQKQPNAMTVQGVLENVLTKINSNKQVFVSASGRTDAHVHALGQRAHFNLDVSIMPMALKKALNSLLPGDIYVKNVEEVTDTFHARYDVKQKEYMYIINVGEYNPIERNYVYQYNKDLDIGAMKEAISYFIGEHDFRSFTKVDDEKDDYVREIYQATISLDENNKNHIVIHFVGTGFLRYMVRNMVGTLIEVGEGKRDAKCISEILNFKDRTKAGKTAPAEGLYLKNVFY